MATNNSINNTLGVATATSIAFNPTTDGIVATAAGDSASAGYVGHFVDSGVVGPTSFTTSGTNQNFTTISLGVGDWDVTGNGYFSSGTATTSLQVSISTTSVTQATAGSTASFLSSYVGGGVINMQPTSFPVTSRITVTTAQAPLTVYLVGLAAYTSTAPTITCQMTARIRR